MKKRSGKTLRIISILVMLSTLLLCQNALGEESEITFRGIPWGSSISETKEFLEKEFGEELTYIVSERDSLSFEDQFLKNSMYEKGPLIKIIVTIPDLNVAGFNVKSLKKDLLW